MVRLYIYIFAALFSHISYADCSIPGWPNCSIEDANIALDKKEQQNFLIQQQQKMIEIQNQQLFELQRANRLKQQQLENNRFTQPIAPMPMNCFTTYNSLTREYETRCQ